MASTVADDESMIRDSKKNGAKVWPAETAELTVGKTVARYQVIAGRCFGARWPSSTLANAIV